MWMRVLGIELCPTAPHPTRHFSLIFGSIMASFTVICRTDQMFNAIQRAAEAKAIIQNGINDTNMTSVTITQAINEILMQFQAILANTGIHVSMFLVFVFRWNSLWRCLVKLEQDSFHGSVLYQRIRRVSVIALIWIAAVGHPTFEYSYKTLNIALIFI